MKLLVALEACDFFAICTPFNLIIIIQRMVLFARHLKILILSVYLLRINLQWLA